ncbi:unnamed protein product [Chironomus riparius]|uniref:Uncharacterized protein n=1 Tax=Chironomus riparius TaxID=315576 RepID=A0A9N9S8Y0_9DIPT|nr:unnamed protein product [Chironomus riparius]
MEDDYISGLFFGTYMFLNFLHTCILTFYIIKLQKSKLFEQNTIVHIDANPYHVSDLINKMPSTETLAPTVEEYEAPLNHQEPKYAEVDPKKTEKYDALNYLQQNTKNNLSYDKLKILSEENQMI